MFSPVSVDIKMSTNSKYLRSCDDVLFCGCTLSTSGELIVSEYIAESITTDAGRFGHIGLYQLSTKLKIVQCETGSY